MAKRTGPRAIAVIWLMALVVVTACGGSSQSPGDGTGSTDAAATDEATGTDDATGTATDDGSGNGTSAGDTSKGVFHAEVTGARTMTIDLGFAPPPLSNFQISEGTSYLAYTDGEKVAFITISEATGLIFQYGDGEVVLSPGAEPCSLDIDEQTSSSAKGSFTCAKGSAISESGGIEEVDITATFDAHQ